VDVNPASGIVSTLPGTLMPSAKATTKPGKVDRKSTVKPFPRTIAGTLTPAQDASRTQILEQYQAAVTAMQQGDYAAAHPALEKLLQIAPSEFADRIRMYLAACIAQSKQSSAEFSSPEEKYDYAISLLNDGQYEDAREHLNEILSNHEGADYAFYGLAVLASMTGDTQTCLDKLTEAIRLNALNRIQARSDSDFQDMTDDPRFTELLYPEA
jgi:tetratricopeptide (TPR) repeat protein